jgi:hypothetical protein
MIEKMQQDQLIDYMHNFCSYPKTPIILAVFAISLAEYETSALLPPGGITIVIPLVRSTPMPHRTRKQ